MNKVEVLNKVKEDIKEYGIIKHVYISPLNMNCCVVGYALKNLGFSTEQLHELDDCTSGIESLFSSGHHEIKTSAVNLLTEAGFTKEELRKLQYTNDGYSNLNSLMILIDIMIRIEEGLSK
jgi:hypothetical protein